MVLLVPLVMLEIGVFCWTQNGTVLCVSVGMSYFFLNFYLINLNYWFWAGLNLFIFWIVRLASFLFAHIMLPSTF